MRDTPDILPDELADADRPAPTQPAPTSRALVILPRAMRGTGHQDGETGRSLEARREEAVGLAEAIGLEVVGAEHVTLRKPVPATLFGSGKVEELAALMREREAGLAIVDHPLSPVQQRNLEKAWTAKVLDRTGLILEIFGERAQTNEGRLQVELAHLSYQRSRLVRSWTHLERQRGGFGFLGGPGETQIESDRRQIDTRIRQIEGSLEGVRTMRAGHRASRKRAAQPVAALVGYTNAGKSTLFNRLTGASVTAKDMLFATLDPTLRRVRLPHGETMILSDTVGFISQLPTQLVAAFRATLEEVVEADIILHVRDIASPESEAQAADVEAVLGELGISPGDPRLLEVWNKVDLLDEAQRMAALARAHSGGGRAVAVSAATGEGIDTLLRTLDQRLAAERATMVVRLRAGQLGAASWLYENAEILERRDDPAGNDAWIQIRIPEQRLDALHAWARENRIALSAAAQGRDGKGA